MLELTAYEQNMNILEGTDMSTWEVMSNEHVTALGLKVTRDYWMSPVFHSDRMEIEVMRFGSGLLVHKIKLVIAKSARAPVDSLKVGEARVKI